MATVSLHKSMLVCDYLEKYKTFNVLGIDINLRDSSKYEEGYFTLIIRDKAYRMIIKDNKLYYNFVSPITKSEIDIDMRMHITKTTGLEILNQLRTFIINRILTPDLNKTLVDILLDDMEAEKRKAEEEARELFYSGGGRKLSKYHLFMKKKLSNGKMTMKQAVKLWKKQNK